MPEVRFLYSKNLKCGTDFGTKQWTFRRALVREESTFNVLCLLLVKFGILRRLPQGLKGKGTEGKGISVVTERLATLLLGLIWKAEDVPSGLGDIAMQIYK